ncbi:MAG: exopolyphosphatase [Proteobacteria bacterium]|nr:MAG: exopolyphosphatase [Pseudomonadota bacterium]
MTEPHGRHIAAVDLGSNSFHMIVVHVDPSGHLRVVDRLREAVRLGSGLDENGHLSAEACSRALACLQRFGERIRELPSRDVAIVGTNTLRNARNARHFLLQAEQALGHPIAIISGREEARLIYLGVAHSLGAADSREARRLVVDIGGGSTELIIGQAYEAQHTESLEMGCVSSSLRFFADGHLGKSRWKAALTAARLELIPIQNSYREIGWEVANGASGTIKAIGKVIQECGLAPYAISLDNMRQIQARMIAAKSLDRLDLPGLSEERKPVFPGGLSILMSVFESLSIEKMHVSGGALREGLVYDLLDPRGHDSLRDCTIAGLQKRFQIDRRHARAVRETALALFDICQNTWALPTHLRELLGWAADLHELGLSISHSGYHKHGAYVLENYDLVGFSKEEQHWLSTLVRVHRRKILSKLFDLLEMDRYNEALYLSVILRIAVLLHRDRNGLIALPLSAVKPAKRSLQLVFMGDSEQRSLLFADLHEEKDYLKSVDFKLKYTI